MTTRRHRSAACRLVAIAILAMGFATNAAHAVVIYSDNFDGPAATNLNGSAPDVAPGAETWVARYFINQDGTGTGTSKGSATLAFTPSNGYIYTLDASLTGMTGNSNWYGLGFADGQSTSYKDTFASGAVIGKAWMLFRGDASSSSNQVLLNGTASVNAWTTYANQSGGDMDMRVVLDTSGGAGNWMATWYAKKPTDGSYFQVGGPSALPDETITSVGIGCSSTGVTATFTNFSLDGVYVPPDLLTLRVNTDTGVVTLLGDDDVPFDIDSYEITSDGNLSLDAAGWLSLQDQDYEGSGPPDGTGAGWEESGGSNSAALQESWLLGQSTISASEAISLGMAYDTSVDAQDLKFEYHDAVADEFVIGNVEYVTGLGDMNGDGTVDSDDVAPFVLALTNRVAYEAAYPGLNADVIGDFDGNSLLDTGDIAAFSLAVSAGGSAEASAVPEPTGAVLLTISACCLLAGKQHRRRVPRNV